MTFLLASAEGVATAPLWPFAVYIALVVLTAAGILGISHVLGQRHKQQDTDKPYESGIEVTSSARLRVPIRFYLVAILFVIFDLEGIFLVAWAVCVRQAGWKGYFEILVFVGVLVASLVYLIRQGALEWVHYGSHSDATGETGPRRKE